MLTLFCRIILVRNLRVKGEKKATRKLNFPYKYLILGRKGNKEIKKVCFLRIFREELNTSKPELDSGKDIFLS